MLSFLTAHQAVNRFPSSPIRPKGLCFDPGCHAPRGARLYWDSLPAFSDIGDPSLITISKYGIQKIYKIKTTTLVVFTVSYTYSLESHLHIQNCTLHLHDQSAEPTCSEPLQVCWQSRMWKITVVFSVPTRIENSC